MHLLIHGRSLQKSVSEPKGSEVLNADSKGSQKEGLYGAGNQSSVCNPDSICVGAAQLKV